MTHRHICPSCQLPCDCECDDPKAVHAVCNRCRARMSPAILAALSDLWPQAGEPRNPNFPDAA